MLDSAVLELARRRVKIDIENQDRALDTRVTRVKEDANRNNALFTARYPVEVAKVCQLAIKERASFVWLGLRDCLKAAGTQYVEGMDGEAKDFVSEFMPAHANWAKWRVQEASSFMSSTAMQLEIVHEVEVTNDATVREISTDIDLYVLALKNSRGDTMTSSSITITNSPNVVLQQSGGNASATVSQIANTAVNAEMIAVLDQIKDALLSVETFVGHSKQDLIELIDDAKSEIAKASPNKSKLKGYFLTVAEVIRGLSTILDEAPTLYENFKIMAERGFNILLG